jgi:hypothetical protein
MLVDDLQRLLTIAQIYHLEIKDENIVIQALLQLIILLPHVKTLKMHSLSPDEQTMFDFDAMNEITTVCLEIMNDVKDFDFLLELCPYMNYLQVNCVKFMDFKFLLRYIVNKIKDECHNHLCSLSFRVPLVDDQMIRKLKIIIQL